MLLLHLLACHTWSDLALGRCCLLPCVATPTVLSAMAVAMDALWLLTVWAAQPCFVKLGNEPDDTGATDLVTITKLDMTPLSATVCVTCSP
jgi:hypothetical protein